MPSPLKNNNAGYFIIDTLKTIFLCFVLMGLLLLSFMVIKNMYQHIFIKHNPRKLYFALRCLKQDLRSASFVTVLNNNHNPLPVRQGNTLRIETLEGTTLLYWLEKNKLMYDENIGDGFTANVLLDNINVPKGKFLFTTPTSQGNCIGINFSFPKPTSRLSFPATKINLLVSLRNNQCGDKL